MSLSLLVGTTVDRDGSYFFIGMAGSQLWKIFQKNSKSSTAGYQTPQSHLWRCCMEPTGLLVFQDSLENFIGVFLISA